MYKWVSTKLEPHGSKFRVAVMTLEGKQERHAFDSASAAQTFIEKASTRRLGNGGHKIETVVEQYLSSRTDLKASSINTIRFRLAPVIRGRQQLPIEIFPWQKAWMQHAAIQSTDSQLGIKSALAGLFDWTIKQRIMRKPPELPEVTGRRSKGKDLLRIDEAKRLIEVAVRERDSIALALVTMLYTGIRPGEAMALTVRDLDDNATVLWVAAEDGKTDASKRMVEVDPPELGAVLAQLAKGRPGSEYLFPFVSQKKTTTNVLKSRTDALHRRLVGLCKRAGVPEVVPHSMRGLHSTIAVERGATGKLVADAIGHTSFERITIPHYLAPGTAERARARRVKKVLGPTCPGNSTAWEVTSNFTSHASKGPSSPTQQTTKTADK